MQPKMTTGVDAIYARYSTDKQRDTSIDDQVRVCRDHIRRLGGDPDRAEVFADYAESGRGADRKDFDRLMTWVVEGRVKRIVTEKVQRLSRDFVDSAMVFRQLQFQSVPLLGVMDGVDTSAKGAKLTFGVHALMADQYIDDLRDMTLRGLEGRALAGFATGGVPFGYRTIPQLDQRGKSTGSLIEINEECAAIVRRIFAEYLNGGALHRIARALNVEGVPSPRAGSRHKRFGWGASTIRAMLYNEKYAGTWRFKERQWVKVPGTNKRQPRAREADEVISSERPELRIIDAETWAEVQGRLRAVHRKYTNAANDGERVETPRRCSYMLSGLLVCDDCGFPMTIYGGGRRYYRCSTNHTKGTCPNDVKAREESLRAVVLDAIREQIHNPKRIAEVRKAVAERLRDYSKEMDADLKDRRDRLKRTEERIRGLVGFIADGDRSEYIVSAMRDLEVQAKAERAAIERLHREAQQPLRLPSIDEVTAAVFRLDALLSGDPEQARARLRRWLKDGEIRVARRPEGGFALRGSIAPLAMAETEKPKPEQGLGSSESNVSSGGRI